MNVGIVGALVCLQMEVGQGGVGGIHFMFVASQHNRNWWRSSSFARVVRVRHVEVDRKSC